MINYHMTEKCFNSCYFQQQHNNVRNRESFNHFHTSHNLRATFSEMQPQTFKRQSSFLWKKISFHCLEKFLSRFNKSRFFLPSNENFHSPP